MKYTLNSNSWHFWLANCGSHRVWSCDDIDFCHYIRCVLAGLFSLIFAWFVIIVLGGMLIHGLWQDLHFLWVWITTGVQDKELVGLPGIFTFAIFMLLVLGSIIWTIQYIKENIIVGSLNKVAKSPGFVGLSIRKFKEKTCFMVNFKDKSQI